jgi:hypothetical protein
MFVSRLLKALCLLLPGLAATAQTAEDFSDGDLTSNPAWTGDLSKFEILAGELHLNAPAVSGSAWLSTPSLAIENAGWEFSVRLTFNPSSTNFINVFLASDQQNLTSPLNGHFVKIGNTTDEISLYRRSGLTDTEIIDGLDGRVNADPVTVRVRVTRNESADWTLTSDVGITGTFATEGTVRDEAHLASTHFGWTCVYTSTRSTSFYVDNISVTGAPVTDRVNPELDSLTTLSATSVRVWFSEEMDETTLTHTANYTLMPGGSNPSTALPAAMNTAVDLTLGSALLNGVPASLRLSGLKDMAGNELSDTTVTVLYFQASPLVYRDIEFTEIFADPSPSVGLPSFEFIEIYNRSSTPASLTGWTLADKTSTSVLPDHILLPGQYVILTSSAGYASYSSAGTTLSVSNFPTLNNDGDRLVLKTGEEQTIDSLEYDLSWYGDDDKEQGGYSLEKIDPNNPCAEEENWTASDSATGGTPGSLNSVNASKPDLSPPKITGVLPLNPAQVLVRFNEKLAYPLTLPTARITNEECLSSESIVSSIAFADRSLRTLVLEVNPPLLPGQTYQLAMHSVEDCAGNSTSLNDCPEGFIPFGLPEAALTGDILINEILFNPRSGGVDFVELVNVSEKFINLKGAGLRNADASVEVFPGDRLFAPGDLLVITPDPQVLISQYPVSDPLKVAQQPLPSLPDDEGSIELLVSDSVTLDLFAYHHNYHSPFVRNEEGVSLERISLSAKTNEASNWTSASAQSGYATPGRVNSQHLEGPSEQGNVSVFPEVFEPQSGSPAFTEIAYRFSTAGRTANVRLLDMAGRVIKTIAANESIGTEGFFRWDGDTDEGSRARMGAYLVWFETFDAAGSVELYRLRVVVARR